MTRLSEPTVAASERSARPGHQLAFPPLQAEKLLTGLTPESLPQSLAPAIRARGQMPLPAELQGQMTAVGAALALAAIDAGATVKCGLGQPITVIGGSTQIEPFNVLQELAEGKLDAATWRSQCDCLGIGGIDLARVGQAPTAA